MFVTSHPKKKHMTYQKKTTKSEQAPIATHHIEGYGG
jgi:hypothetical protein